VVKREKINSQGGKREKREYSSKDRKNLSFNGLIYFK